MYIKEVAMSSDLILNLLKYLIILTILFFSINLQPINFYVDVKNLVNKIELDHLIYLPHYFIFDYIESFEFEKYSSIYHNIFLLISLIIFIVPITFHSLYNKNLDENKEFINIFLCSIIFPISLQSVTSPNSESFFSIIIIYVTSLILCKNSKIKIIPIITPIFIYSYFIDPGNFLVFLFFIIFLITILIVNKIFNWKVSFILFFIIFIISLSYSKGILSYVGQFFDINKTLRLVSNLEMLSIDNLNLIEILKRYVYFWFTLFGFMNHLKLFIVSTILIMIVVFSNLFLRSFKNLNIFKQKYYNSKIIITFCCIFFFPLILITILPTHAYGKYYVFVVPFLIKFLSIYFTKSSLFILSIIYSSAYILNSYYVIYSNSRIIDLI